MTGIPSYLLDGTTPPIGYVVNPGNVPPVANPSRYVWTGAVTATSFATRVAAIEGDILLVSTIAGAVVAHTTVTGADITVSDDILGTARGSTTSVARATFSGLDPSTTYYLSVVPNGSTTSRVVAKLATFPEEGSPASFSFTVGSNARYQGDVGKTYNAMLAQDPLFFLQLGNLIYSDRTTDDRSLAGQQYVSVLSARAPLAFFANKPVIYVYGEHDYGPRNSNMTSLASSASQWAFSAYYPAYTLPTTNNVQLAYQAFTVGRVRFVLTDLFAQSTGLVSDPAARSLLGSAQKQMFLAELANFRQYQLIIWGSAKPWHRPKNNNSDGWSGYWVERQAIADAISQLGVNNLIILVGGESYLGVDNGALTDFSTSGPGAGAPLLQAAPMADFCLATTSSSAQFSQGSYGFTAYPNWQYGTVTITDTADLTCARLDGTVPGYAPVLSVTVCRNATHPSIMKQSRSHIVSTETPAGMDRWGPGFTLATVFMGLIVVVFVIVNVVYRGIRPLLELIGVAGRLGKRYRVHRRHRSSNRSAGGGGGGGGGSADDKRRRSSTSTSSRSGRRKSSFATTPATMAVVAKSTTPGAGIRGAAEITDTGTSGPGLVHFAQGTANDPIILGTPPAAADALPPPPSAHAARGPEMVALLSDDPNALLDRRHNNARHAAV